MQSAPGRPDRDTLSSRSLWVIAVVWGLAYFCVLYAIGIPVEEYDGMNRRLVADSLWNGGPVGSTWFDFGSIFSFYLFYFPASFLKATLHLSTQLSDVALQLHSGLFAAATGSLMLAFVLRWTREEPRQQRSGSLAIGLLLSLVFCCNPLAYSSERYLIETPLAFYLLAVVYMHAFDSGPQKTSRHGWLLCPLVAMAVWTRGPSALFFLPLLVLSLHQRRYAQAAATSMGLAFGTVGTLWWNLHRYGSLFGYSYGQQTFDASTLHGLYAFVFSPGLGIFTFYPLSMLATVLLVRGFMRKDALARAISCSLMIFTLLFASWCVYNGGLSYGPRFLVPLLPVFGVYGILELRRIRSSRVKWAVGVCLVAWGAYINLNALLLPPNFFYSQWAQGAPIWEMPAEEKQIQMDFAERLEIYDPAFSNYTGSIGTFFSRRDVWELPFLKFAARDVTTVFTLAPREPIQTIAFISRGRKAGPWVINSIKITEADGVSTVPFHVIGDDSWHLSDDQKRARNTTGLRSQAINPGTRLILSLDSAHEGVVNVEMSHGGNHEGFPHSYVVQSEPGKYFRGNLNDPSYIPFSKGFRCFNQIAGLERGVMPLVAGISLSLFVYGWLKRRLKAEV